MDKNLYDQTHELSLESILFREEAQTNPDSKLQTATLADMLVYMRVYIYTLSVSFQTTQISTFEANFIS